MEQLNLNDPRKIKAGTTYNRAAEHFDDTPLGFWDATGRTTIKFLDLEPGSVVLDVGCGSGASAVPAAESVGPNGSVIGVDLAEKLLELARTKAAERDLHNIEFRLADMTDLGFPDNHFDAVISVFSVFFVEDMEGLIRELWRMVKPGGKLAITTWGSDFWEPVYTVWREAIQSARPDLYTAFNPWDRINSPDQLYQLLEASGVPEPKITPVDRMQPLQTPEDWWTMVLGSGLRGTVDAMDAPTAQFIYDRTVGWTRDNNVKAIQTNALYAIATKG